MSRLLVSCVAGLLTVAVAVLATPAGPARSLDGKATGTLQGMAGLGPASLATITDYSFTDNRLAVTLRVEPGGGRPVQTSTVEAACSR